MRDVSADSIAKPGLDVRRAHAVSSALSPVGLGISSVWLLFCYLSGSVLATLAAMLAVAGCLSAIALMRRGIFRLANVIWLSAVSLAIFAGTYIVHPDGQMPIMFYLMAGLPFMVFSLRQDRPFILAMVLLPLVFLGLDLLGIRLYPMDPTLNAEDSRRIFLPLVTVSVAGGIVFQIFYFALTMHNFADQAERARRAAETSSRAKTALLSGISHEMRTPLNAVIGLADLIAYEGTAKGDAKLAERAGQIEEAGHVLLSSVSKTVQFADLSSRTESPDKTPLALPPLVQEVLRDHAAEIAARGMQAEVDVAAVPVLADADLLRDALGQIVENACRYGRKGGTIRIASGPTADGFHRITVVDDGPGFGVADATQAFAPFERLSQATGTTFGAGMGLPIARAKIEAMGGRIGIEASQSPGARVWVDLALAKGAVDQPSDPASATRASKSIT